MSSVFYPIVFKTSYLLVIVPTVLVVVTAWLSAREMGGTLGQGLKKLAVGSITHTILFTTYLLLEKGAQGVISEDVVYGLFIFGAIFGAIFLILGYIQIYKITKKLKLFTV